MNTATSEQTAEPSGDLSQSLTEHQLVSALFHSYGLWTFISDPLILPPMTEKIDHEDEEPRDATHVTEPGVRGLDKPLSKLVLHGYPLLRVYGVTTIQNMIQLRSLGDSETTVVSNVLKGQSITSLDSEFVLWAKEEAQLVPLKTRNENIAKTSEIEVAEELSAVENPWSVYQTSIMFQPFTQKTEYVWARITSFGKYKVAVSGILNELFYLTCIPSFKRSIPTITRWGRVLLEEVLGTRQALFCPKSLRRLCHFDFIWGDRLGLHIKERSSLSQVPLNKDVMAKSFNLKVCAATISHHSTPAVPTYPTAMASQYSTYSVTYMQTDELLHNLANINRAVALGLNG